MSITTPDDRISTYNPVVATTTFAALFPVFDNSDLSVFVDGVQRNDFTVSATYINSISNDAAVVFSPGIVGEVKVIGTRDPRRISRFLDGAPLPTRDQNTALDVVMASIQELARDVKRAVKVGFGAIGFDVDTTGIADNSVLMYRDDKIVIGPTAGDVANAQTNAASAADSAIKAQKWADNPLNQEVIAGRFSAMHWALKALEWAGAGVAGVSSFNGRAGAVMPQAGDYPNKQDATHAAPTKAVIADGDELNIADSEDSFKAKRSTLSELIASIFKAGRTIANAQFEAATLKLLNAAGKAISFNLSALTAARSIAFPDRDVDLGLVPRTAPFVSTQQSFVAGSSLVTAHGLGAQPTEVSLEFVCKTAWNNYAVGDRVLMPSSTAAHDENYTNTGYSVSVDATNVRVHFASNGVPLVTKGGGATPFFGGTQFDVIVRARI